MDNEKDEKQYDEQRMRAFAEHFEHKLFPIIKGEDGEGLVRLRQIVEEKRKDVEKRNQARRQKGNHEGGDY